MLNKQCFKTIWANVLKNRRVHIKVQISDFSLKIQWHGNEVSITTWQELTWPQRTPHAPSGSPPWPAAFFTPCLAAEALAFRAQLTEMVESDMLAELRLGWVLVSGRARVLPPRVLRRTAGPQLSLSSSWLDGVSTHHPPGSRPPTHHLLTSHLGQPLSQLQPCSSAMPMVDTGAWISTALWDPRPRWGGHAHVNGLSVNSVNVALV